MGTNVAVEWHKNGTWVSPLSSLTVGHGSELFIVTADPHPVSCGPSCPGGHVHTSFSLSVSFAWFGPPPH